MRTICFLNPPPPTSNASLIPSKPPQLVSSVTKTEGCWRRQCVAMGVACTIIGLEMCNSLALAHQALQITTMPKANETLSNTNNSYGATQWSQKRTCPSWRGSSLETIVPENLPRPSARRRYQAVGSTSKTAPPLSAAAKLEGKKGSCFSM
ncbi:uncharacterized protein LOC109788614 [Cajanus cajan]|uniref:Uncharacterized protein n=1 Tax=Cajanus cajan TaxID=3821 RepID=A0A151RAQ3_CAJCA|nr:uncharacterized protein LOC109788614 [Cajanus cajan]KYP39569.1 hypothetical protein KK1_039130 [Cajanus cajan]